MSTLVAGSASRASVIVQADGAPLAVVEPVTARVFSIDGRVERIASRALTSAPSWATGAIDVAFTAEDTAELPVGDAMLVLEGDFGIRRYRLIVETIFEPTRTSLFIKDIAIDELRRDRLVAASAGVLQDVKVSDNYLWDKIRAAESEVSHALRVPLVPTRFFPVKPTEEQLAALDGMAWAVDDGNDYNPSDFERDKWGYIVTRHRPIISIESLRFVYPSATDSAFDIPLDWLKYDARYGHVRIVPTSSAAFISSTGFMLAGLAGQKVIPSMVQLTYTAGLENAAAQYPELLDLIKKKAVLKVVADAFLPSSGSISADGLSQSISVDMSAYAEAVDEGLYGPKGTNGGLMTKIHGIRVMVA